MKSKRIYFVLKTLIILFISQSAISQILPHEVVPLIQKGINLGNTLEPPLEHGWNNPNAEEYYFDLYKEAGFQLIRIPVRWDKHTSTTPPYKVNDSWMNRVEQVADWGLSRGLFVIINAHHDDWIKNDYSPENKARFDSIWTQISERFKSKSDRLIFEVLNEPHGLSKANNDDMHARILSIIRKTNPTRLVIIQGNNWGGSDDLLNAAIPKDSFLLGSFHSYDPYLFGLEGQGTWGSQADINTLENKFKAVSNWSEQTNIPAFLGEFGSLKKCDYNSRMKHYRIYTTLAQKYKIPCAAWDDGGNFRIMEREQHDWDEVKDILIHTTAESPWPVAKVYQDSIVKLTWVNYTTENDSFYIQRKLGTERHYKTIKTIAGGTNTYSDIKPPLFDKYYNYRVIAHFNDSTDLYSQPCQTFYPKWERQVRVPFNGGQPLPVPGIIEAEDFDYGGEGLAYHDTDPDNIAGEYRPNEGVDIYNRLGDGYHIGNAIAGEWYTYTINVAESRTYTITTYLAALFGGGTFQIEIDSVKSEVLTAPTCYSWLETKPVSFDMYLTAGTHIMKFTVLSEPLFNIDKFNFDFKTANSIVKQTEVDFNTYQNNSGNLVIKTNNYKHFSQLAVYTIEGRKLWSTFHVNPLNNISKNELNKGVLIVEACGKDFKLTKKVILN